jgi:hypothetical protein
MEVGPVAIDQLPLEADASGNGFDSRAADQRLDLIQKDGFEARRGDGKIFPAPAHHMAA